MDVYNFVHDGKRQYLFFSMVRAIHVCFHHGTGRNVHVLFHCCTGERNEEHTAFGTNAVVSQVKVIRRTYHIVIHTYIINGYKFEICNLYT